MFQISFIGPRENIFLRGKEDVSPRPHDQLYNPNQTSMPIIFDS